MRIAFLSDIHGNLPALRAALDQVEEWGAHRIVVAGDVVGSGPFPRECVHLLREHPRVMAIRGNVDRGVLRMRARKRGKVERILERGKEKSNRAWTALALDDAAAGWLRTLPPELEFTVQGQAGRVSAVDPAAPAPNGATRVLVVHGSPKGDEDYIYPSLTEEALTTKLGPRSTRPPDVLVSGHSHVPFVRRVADTLVINCGSVGRPADGDPRGSLVLAELKDGDAPRAELVRFEYPIDEVVDALAEREVPAVEAEEYRRGVKW